MTARPEFDLVLVDADVVAKLAQWELLEILPAFFQRPWRQFSTTAGLVHRARHATTKADRLFRTVQSAARALAAIEQMGNPPTPLDEEFLLASQREPGIDPGEAILFATAAANPSACIVTGDKRAVTAVASANGLQIGALRGRVICVEQLVLYALDTLGLDALRARLCREPVVDRVIAVVMGSRCDASEENVRAGLRSYIADLRHEAAALLAS